MDDRRIKDRTLAIDGGIPLRATPMPPWPHLDDDTIEAATAVLRSGKLNYHSGRQGRMFEEELADMIGRRHAVAVANGSVALELALHALGIGAGDEVIVSCRSFIASASCCVMRGAIPVFADVDPLSQNVTSQSIRTLIGPRTKAIIVVHLAGWPCEMDPIMELAAEHGLRVIEDCAQAQGAVYRGRPIGSIGHAAVFSFCNDKILTTGGEGGMLVTDDRSVWQRAWSFKDHGKGWQAVGQSNKVNVFRWLHESFGTNWRMTEMQAAMGRVQLAKLPGWVATRRGHAALFDRRLGAIPQLRVTVPPKHARHAYYKYGTFLRPDRLRAGWSRDRVVWALQNEGVPCGSGACPEIYLEKAFDNSTMRPDQRLPVAKQLGQTSLMFPVHPTLCKDDVLDICRAVEKVLRAAAVDEKTLMARAA